ncbi:uncharacterized protein LOC134278201 [Saccostrea cucullata]|uniref:uncharacterized protein LOC134278201 n=1 Tax=Saccostrea cuccullata TaxID=36930 RepID=UPI002ED62B5D
MLVVCMRFGTSNCKLLFSFRSEPLNASGCKTIEIARKHFSSDEMSILLDKNGRVVALGYEVEMKYETEKEHRLIKLSKNAMKIALGVLSGNPLTYQKTADVVLSCLQYMLEILEEQIKERVGFISFEKDVFLVLILPSHLQHIAREISSKKIGPKRYRFLIVSEIDAIVCLMDRLDETMMRLKTKPWINFSVGCRYLLLFCGGITNATILTMNPDGTHQTIVCKETRGGFYIYHRVLNVIRGIFGKEVIEEFEKEEKIHYLQWMQEVGSRKKRLSTEGYFQIPIASNFLEFHKRKMRREPSIYEQSNSIYKVELIGDRSFINGKFIIDECYQEILEYTENVLGEYETNNIVLYGGHGNCEYFRLLISTRFPNVRIVVPYNSDLAIAKGGTLYGHLHKPQV